jgi:plasmid stabilization system protein ParE
MNYTFHPDAESELEGAENHYDAIDTSLGNRFRAEFEAGLERILKFPNAWQPLSKNIRRRRLVSFPYGVVYRLKPDEIRILAVMHLHRAPDYWRNRIKS